MQDVRTEPSRDYVIAAGLITAFLLWFVLYFRLLPALLAGLLVFESVHVLTPRLRFVKERKARYLAVGLLVSVVVALLGLAIVGAVLFFRSESGGYVALLRKSAEVIASWHGRLPDWVVRSLPADADALQTAIVGWLQQHVTDVRTIGGEAVQVLVRIVIGMVLGALVALLQADPPTDYRPLALALVNRAARFGEAFRRIVFAQVRIAAVNAVLTALYLLIVLPLFGVHLPLIKTMIAVTFIAGLIPVFGNLISNVVIVVVSLSVSPIVAVWSLLYLVAIHKLEYFLNARMVGTQIEALAWELLLAMLLMEAAFGVAGLIAAPIYYAYVKSELAARGWV
ncbi:AI-2E family transporter [Piscinibacter koreensis]|uniref:AI-2E family transporter n=1 Tax=Piscinibacter koreensis TaxID=2742824 RepID=A0A7Y6NNQ4_9BURK|nr:AI-2E family transporter [Schlegelella koreensis]NUZ06567.1 AI-2E family transporter [Schlegelella koreensis]